MKDWRAPAAGVPIWKGDQGKEGVRVTEKADSIIILSVWPAKKSATEEAVSKGWRKGNNRERQQVSLEARQIGKERNIHNQ